MRELRPVEIEQLVEVGQVERPVDLVDLVVPDAESLLQPLQHRPRGRGRDLEADGVAEAAPLQLLLDRLEQVVRVVRDLEVGVAGDAEDRALDDLHAREEPVEEVRDHVLEHQQPATADGEEARQAFGHLDAGEALLAGLGIAREHAEAERQPGDVGEALAGADRERRQHREDLALEAVAELAQLVLVEIPRGSRSGSPRRRGAGQSSFFQSFDWRAVSSSTRSRISARAARGVSPSLERTTIPAAACSVRPATRTMKNSSRFDEKKRHILTRSSSGRLSSAAGRAAARCTPGSRARG